MRDLLAAAGGPTEPLQALLIGGYFGTWVARRGRRLRLAREELRAVGCALGSGVLFALGESSCGLHESARVIATWPPQSAGQCGPCVYGLAAIADAVAAIADGVARRAASCERLRRGRPRSAAAAPATTPTARSASSRARSGCSATSSTTTSTRAARRARPGSPPRPWPADGRPRPGRVAALR